MYAGKSTLHMPDMKNLNLQHRTSYNLSMFHTQRERPLEIFNKRLTYVRKEATAVLI